MPTTRITSAAPAARMGRENPVGLGAVSGFDGRTRSQTAMAISNVAVGQAMALTMNPARVAPKEFCNKLAVSPMTLRVMPLASRSQGVRRLPGRTAHPPTTRPRRCR